MHRIVRVLDEIMPRDFRLDPLGDHKRSPGGRFRKNDSELLSPVPRNDIRGTSALPEEFPDLPKRKITSRVPEAVVELLEVVHVDHQKRQAVLVPTGTLEFPAQRLVEFPMII